MSETKFNCVEWLQNYKEDIRKIKDISPFLTVLGVSVGIEFIGKLLSAEDLDSGGSCNIKFEKALSEFESLKKYAEKDFYSLIRCGLAHRVSPKKNIILSSKSDSDLSAEPIILNSNSFFEDFSSAVEEAQSKTDWENPEANIEYVTIREDTDTGMTQTFVEGTE